MTFAELTVKFKTEGAASVKKDVADVGGMINQFAGKVGLATTGAGLAADAIIGVAGAIYTAGKAAVDAAVKFDSNIRALAIYSKNSIELANQMERLKEIAKAPGLGLPELMLGVARLRGAGLSAQQAESAMKQFGNAVALAGGGKEQLDGIAVALMQIASKGKVSAEEIGQIAERAPQIRQAMQAAFGTADPEQLQKMGISVDEFFNKINTAMANLPRASGGMQNMIDNLKDSMNEVLVIVGAGFQALFSGPGGAGAMEGIMAGIQEAANVFYETMAGIAQSETFIAIKNNFATIVQAFRNMAPVLT
jgi:tape measure domain-containing protein